VHDSVKFMVGGKEEEIYRILPRDRGAHSTLQSGRNDVQRSDGCGECVAPGGKSSSQNFIKETRVLNEDEFLESQQTQHKFVESI
jgi:hypothetical protein